MAGTRIREYQLEDRDRCRSLWAEMPHHHQDIYNDPSIGGDDPGIEFDNHPDQWRPGSELLGRPFDCWRRASGAAAALDEVEV